MSPNQLRDFQSRRSLLIGFGKGQFPCYRHHRIYRDIMNRIKTLITVNYIEKFATPTLRALAYGGPDTPMLNYYGRSVDRLWLDGGSTMGFRLCRLLGWAEWPSGYWDLAGYCNHERLGRLTDAGRAEFWRLWRVSPPIVGDPPVIVDKAA